MPDRHCEALHLWLLNEKMISETFLKETCDLAPHVHTQVNIILLHCSHDIAEREEVLF